MSMYGRLAERNNCHFSNYPSSQTKLLRSFSFCCHVCLDVVLETMPMKLYGRSHPDPKTLQRWSTLRVMDPMEVKGRSGSKVPCKVHGFKGLIMWFKVSVQGLFMRFQGLPVA